MLEFENLDEQQFLSLLNPGDFKNSPWRVLSLEILGDFYLSKGQKIKAKDILDQEGKIQFVNESAMIFFGRSEAELLGSDFGVPVCDQNGKMEIEICNQQRDVRIISILVSKIDWEEKPATFVSLHDITEQKKTEESLRYQAYHDLLTGLPNRTAVMERIEQVLDCQHIYPNYYFALLFIDLDRFKIVNIASVI